MIHPIFGLLAILTICATAALAQDDAGRRELCLDRMKVSQAIAERSKAATQSYRASGSEADYCTVVDTSRRLHDAASEAVRACERDFPAEMVAERRQVAELKAFNREQRSTYAKRCGSGRASVPEGLGACSDAATAATATINSGLIAYNHIVNEPPSAATCSHYRTLDDQLAAFARVFRACRGVPPETYGANTYHRYDQVVRTGLAKHRKAHPKLCC